MRIAIVINRLRIQNANSISSPYTIGFPAMTAWMGAVHGLQRKLNQEEVFSSLRFSGVGVVSHSFSLDVYRDRGTPNYLLVGTGNPLTKKGERAPFIEEGRCSLVVSLVLEVEEFSMQWRDLLTQRIESLLLGSSKFAGGDVIAVGSLKLFAIENDGDFKQLKRLLMPGYLLIERKDLIIEAMKGGMDAMDAVLEYLKVFNTCTSEPSVEWKRNRKVPGYILPIAVGYQRISDYFESNYQRDFSVQHCFAETVVTLGEFVMPYRIKDFEEMLWHYRCQGNGLYLCANENVNNKEKE